jgi:dTDP-glucose 4,6-dehydratase
VRELGWSPATRFDEGLASTVEWYRANEWWWRPIKERTDVIRWGTGQKVS